MNVRNDLVMKQTNINRQWRLIFPWAPVLQPPLIFNSLDSLKPSDAYMRQ